MEKILESAVEIKSRNYAHEHHVGLYLETIAMLAHVTSNFDLGLPVWSPASKTPSAPLHQNSTENVNWKVIKNE
jgi:hypothetical protein